MGAGDKFDHKVDEAKGNVKEQFGQATDNEDLEAEGKADQTEGKLGQAADKAKDAVGNVKDAFKD